MPNEIHTTPKKSPNFHLKAKKLRKQLFLRVIVVLTSILSDTLCSDEGLKFTVPTFYKNPSSYLSQPPITHRITLDGSTDKVLTMKEGVNQLKLEDGEYQLQIEIIKRGSYFVIPSLHLDGKPPQYTSQDKILNFYG